MLLLSLVLLEIAAHIGLVLWPHFHKPTVTDVLSGNPAYADFSWARECMKEQVAREHDTYFPFRLWGVADFHGNCFNNDVSSKPKRRPDDRRGL